MKTLRNRKAARKALQMHQRTHDLGERRIAECRFESCMSTLRRARDHGYAVSTENEVLWDAVDAASKLLKLKGR